MCAVGAQLAQDGQPVGARQHHVEHDEIGPVGLQPRFGARRRRRPRGPACRRAARYVATTSRTIGSSSTTSTCGPSGAVTLVTVRPGRGGRSAAPAASFAIVSRPAGPSWAARAYRSRHGRRDGALPRQRRAVVVAARASGHPPVKARSPASSPQASPSASSELVCGIAGGGPSLVTAVGTQFIDRFAASLEGPRRSSCSAPTTRPRSSTGIVVVSLALGAVLGKAAVRRSWVARRRLRRVRGDRPVVVPRRTRWARRPRASSPPCSRRAAGIGTLFGLLLAAARRTRRQRCRRLPADRASSRRLFLTAAGSLAVIAAGAAVLGRRLGRSDVVESAREPPTCRRRPARRCRRPRRRDRSRTCRGCRPTSRRTTTSTASTPRWSSRRSTSPTGS